MTKGIFRNWQHLKGNAARVYVLQRAVEANQVLQDYQEPTVCAHFGCGKHLSLIEQLAGKVCTEHMNIKSKSLTSYGRL